MKIDCESSSRKMDWYIKEIFFIVMLAIWVVPAVHQELEEDNKHFEHILRAHEVVPDVIDDADIAVALEVAYADGAVVNSGDELTTLQTRDPPVEVQWIADSKQFYTLIMADPDAPSRASPTYRSWQHWVVCNIPGTEINKGDTLTEYAGPTPPEGTDLHRYVFLVYLQQQGKGDFKEPIIKNDNPLRGKFSVREFAAKHHLEKPIAINFFQAKYLAPKIQDQLRTKPAL